MRKKVRETKSRAKTISCTWCRLPRLYCGMCRQRPKVEREGPKPPDAWPREKGWIRKKYGV